MFLSLLSTWTQAQSLTCNRSGNFTLDPDCTGIVEADDVLEGTQNSTYTVNLFYDQAMTQPVPTSPMLTSSEVGMTITAQVVDNATGNNCWGLLNVEDKTAPVLNCDCPVGNTDPTCSFACYEDLNTNAPQVTETCGAFDLTSNDVVNGGGRCGITSILRTWTAVDPSGNVSTCTQEFRILPTTLAEVDLPPNFDGIDEPALLCENICGGDLESRDFSFCETPTTPFYWNTLPNGYPSPEDGKLFPCGAVKCNGTGTPGNICDNINVSYSDTRLDVCNTSGGEAGNCFKIIRQWTLLDWCTGEVLNHNQVIKVDDDKAPQINGVNDLTISTDIWGCEAEWFATQPWLTDNCNSAPLEYRVEVSGATVEFRNGLWLVKGLTPGVHDVVYVTEDCCGNVGRTTIELTVLDDAPPVAICDQFTVVNLTTTYNIDSEDLGTSKVFAHTFDDGSFDGCQNQIYFKAMRMAEIDADEDGDTRGEEMVRDGNYEAVTCGEANGDDDVRPFPPSRVFSSALGLNLVSHPNYPQRSQSYFDDFVKFCCEDIPNNPTTVVFRVYDVDPAPYEFRNVFPASDGAYASWYASNPHKDPSDYTGVLPEAESVMNWPTNGGGPGPLYGRYNDCMVQVTVQDKLPPRIVPPTDVVVTCDFWFPFDPDNANDYTDELDEYFGKVVVGSADPADRDSIVTRDVVCPAHPRFSQFAPSNPDSDPCYDTQYNIFWGFDGYALDNCAVNLTQSVSPNLTCGQGRIVRTWLAQDDFGNQSNFATQNITIINCRDFWVPSVCWRRTSGDLGSCDRVTGVGGNQWSNKLIEWPCDVELDRCQGPIDEVFKPENLAVRFEEDRRPRIDDDNCSNIGATYDDETFVFVDSSCVKIFRKWHVIDWCRYDAGIVPNQWEFTQVIKLLNTEGPKFSACEDVTVCGYGDANGVGCVGEVTLDPGITDDCTKPGELRIDFKLDAFNDGNYDLLGYSDSYPAGYPFPNPNNLPVRRFAADDYALTDFFPVGTHRIVWGAEDGCGNANVCEYEFTIEDCKPPTPYCRLGVSTIPMIVQAGGYVEIWASDFNIGSTDNCSEEDDLRYAFSDNPTDNVIRRTCDDVTGIPEDLRIYVFDEAGNYATCEVGLLLTDCDNQSSIAGTISTGAGEAIELVRVDVEGDMIDHKMTDNRGFYGFAADEGNNYMVKPSKDDDLLNGISTYDLVLLSQHLRGIRSIDNPYQLIAADINNTGSITAFDIIELRKALLFISTSFDNNSSWRFVDKSYVFPNANDPFETSFPEIYNINGLAGSVLADFVGIKVGDLDGSARANAQSNPTSQNRSAGFDLGLEDIRLEAGQKHTIALRAKEAGEILGYQLDLKLGQHLSLVDVIGPDGLTLGSDQQNLIGNDLLISWVSENDRAIKFDEAIVSITVVADQTTNLKDEISLGTLFTSELYDVNLDGRDLNLEFGKAQPGEFALMQNTPNPFRGETLIGFVLPASGDATLRVFDASGKHLLTRSGAFEAGYNELRLNSSELSATGIIYYQLEAADWTATRRMLIME